jgi:hypothetical protein
MGGARLASSPEEVFRAEDELLIEGRPPRDQPGPRALGQGLPQHDSSSHALRLAADLPEPHRIDKPVPVRDNGRLCHLTLGAIFACGEQLEASTHRPRASSKAVAAAHALEEGAAIDFGHYEPIQHGLDQAIQRVQHAGDGDVPLPVFTDQMRRDRAAWALLAPERRWRRSRSCCRGTSSQSWMASNLTYKLIRYTV